MFNFTTQTVYNQISTTGSNKNMWVAIGTKKPALRIGNTRFDAADILDIQIKNPTPENLASVTFDMQKVLDQFATPTDTTARILLYIGLSMNCQDSFYANALVYKGKPVAIEIPVKKSDDAAILAKRAKSIADKYILTFEDGKFLNVTTNTTPASGDDPATGTVTFTGINGYQQFKAASLQVYNPEAKEINCCEKLGDFENIIIGVPVVYTAENGIVSLGNQKLTEDGTKVALEENEVAIAPGIEAFGDYNWIIHNLRLPTAANTNFWATTKEEMPVPGQEYVQFIVRISKERDGISGEIVGARAKSVTTHVLYVAKGSASTAVKNAFVALGITPKTDADDVLELPYGV